jgi:tRNA-splicing ligase RtcB
MIQVSVGGVSYYEHHKCKSVRGASCSFFLSCFLSWRRCCLFQRGAIDRSAPADRRQRGGRAHISLWARRQAKQRHFHPSAMAPGVRSHGMRRFDVGAIARSSMILLRMASIYAVSPSSRGVAPGAYKDVSAVVAAAEQTGLARRVARLKPVICIKG